MTDVFMTVDRREHDGALQVSIEAGGTGYRIAGPKYDGSSRNVVRRKLTKRDADEIKRYLRRILG